MGDKSLTLGDKGETAGAEGRGEAAGAEGRGEGAGAEETEDLMSLGLVSTFHFDFHSNNMTKWFGDFNLLA